MSPPEFATRWAVVVGIDHYSDYEPQMNLAGCANDALAIRDFALRSLHVPHSNIRLHISRNPAAISTNTPPDPPSRRATRNEVLRSINEVASLSKPGDLLLFHFSGHGDRSPTKYPHLKTAFAQDEVLCFLDDAILEDVELGGLLDKLSAPPYNLVILAILDCCFSGGATRHGSEYHIRCKPKAISSPNQADSTLTEEELLTDEESSSRGTRNARVPESWFHRYRAYNVIASCQPHETSKERRDASGKWQGVMTSCLMTTMSSLGNLRVGLTYSGLQAELQAKVKDKLRDRQLPMIIGDQDRLVFERLTRQELNSFRCTVLREENSALILDKGGVSGVDLGDVYRIERRDVELAQFLPLAARQPSRDVFTSVVITTVFPFSSEAKPNPFETRNFTQNTDLSTIPTGSVASLQRRGRSVYALFRIYPGQESLQPIRDVQEKWRREVDLKNPVRFVFSYSAESPIPQERPRFHIELRNGALVVAKWDRKKFSHLGGIAANAQDHDLTRQLMYRLIHLQAFSLLLELKPPPGTQTPAFAFNVSLAPTDPKSSATSSWTIHAHNHHSGVLFITAMNLTPLYGIEQMFPDPQEAQGIPLEPGASWEDTIDIEVPDALKWASLQPSFSMQDVIKILVTTEPVDFTKYQLKDLVDAEKYNFRHIRKRAPEMSPWFVEQRTITTRQTPHGFASSIA